MLLTLGWSPRGRRGGGQRRRGNRGKKRKRATQSRGIVRRDSHSHVSLLLLCVFSSCLTMEIRSDEEEAEQSRAGREKGKQRPHSQSSTK